MPDYDVIVVGAGNAALAAANSAHETGAKKVLVPFEWKIFFNRAELKWK